MAATGECRGGRHPDTAEEPLEAVAAQLDVLTRSQRRRRLVLAATRTLHRWSAGSDWQLATAAIGMLLAAPDDHAAVDEAAAVGAGDLHLAPPEPDAESSPPPQRPTRRRGSFLPFDLALTSGQHLDAAEAHPDLGMLTQAENAPLHGVVAAAPATRYSRRLEMIGTNRGHRHGRSLPPTSLLRLAGYRAPA
jgi:hypothetical protein